MATGRTISRIFGTRVILADSPNAYEQNDVRSYRTLFEGKHLSVLPRRHNSAHVSHSFISDAAVRLFSSRLYV